MIQCHLKTYMYFKTLQKDFVKKTVQIKEQDILLPEKSLLFPHFLSGNSSIIIICMASSPCFRNVLKDIKNVSCQTWPETEFKSVVLCVFRCLNTVVLFLENLNHITDRLLIIIFWYQVVSEELSGYSNHYKIVSLSRFSFKNQIIIYRVKKNRNWL